MIDRKRFLLPVQKSTEFDPKLNQIWENFFWENTGRFVPMELGLFLYVF